MTGKWTDQLLDQMREIIDPTADEVVASVINSGGRKALDQMMRDLVENRDQIPAPLPPIVKDYFEKTQALPTWVDRDKIVQGENVFNQYGPEMISMLFFVSLPSAYAMQKGSHVLAITAELTQHVHRRIFRTAQFIMDVMQPGGLAPNGRGVRSAQKVRLIHASIRYYIANDAKWQSGWNPDWGKPVNQEDMAGTLTDFSVGLMSGLQRGKIRLSKEEAEAYLYCWSVVGHIIGVRPELIPATVEEAYDLAKTIFTRQLGASDSGKVLSKDFIRFMQGFLPRFFWGFPVTAIRYFAGSKVANIIESGPYDWTLAFIYVQTLLFGFIEKFKRSHPGLEKYVRILTWHLVNKVVLFEEGGQFYFEIPDVLRKSWRLPPRHT